ncbi:hypothetical protein CUJ83_08585 [Methanocella sp. CWC-04]|uniref:ABC-2 type transport system permease protein n=1 Tax=Methanooceanicella nereidis TaxID=2052831 RepID=A0AAP2RF37_9EURY|nr:ABC transporter permease subunit [Methanocella sp. CWC-04]MCD1295052.1 hypothetical protein [Methanocella sp. CWC-04]
MSANSSLVRETNKGWTTGLSNMLSKENGEWWNLKSILMQLIIWTFIVNGIVAMILFIVPNMAASEGSADAQNTPGTSTPEELAHEGMMVFFNLSAMAISIGAIIISHESILKERETGTAAWVLSKPVSRKAFVISKFFANGIGVLLIIVLIQGAISYGLCSIVQGTPIDLVPYFAAVCVLGLICLFYTTLSIAMGVFSNSKAAVIGIPMLILFMGSMLSQFIQPLQYIVPHTLVPVSAGLATGAGMQQIMVVPILATAAWIAVFIGITLWKFERIDL